MGRRHLERADEAFEHAADGLLLAVEIKADRTRPLAGIGDPNANGAGENETLIDGQLKRLILACGLSEDGLGPCDQFGALPEQLSAVGVERSGLRRLAYACDCELFASAKDSSHLIGAKTDQRLDPAR